MAKAIVIYELKYGNTKLVAETILESINEIERIRLKFKPKPKIKI